jgi:hypothetical protein
VRRRRAFRTALPEMDERHRATERLVRFARARAARIPVAAVAELGVQPERVRRFASAAADVTLPIGWPEPEASFGRLTSERACSVPRQLAVWGAPEP